MSSHIPPPAKRVRQQYTNSYKSNVIQWHFSQNAISKRNTCRHFNIDRKQITEWIKIKEKIKNSAVDIEKQTLKRAKTPPKNWKVRHIDEPMIDWIKTERTTGRCVTREAVQHQAIAMNAATGGDESFVASPGWLQKFQHR
jgi:hypothetical protein